ncbi:hypothetical protein ACS0TY_024249 [Phlomoides rotata]
MWDIPSELFREILSRVPAGTLLRFRCVSMAWKTTIDDPTFIRLHLHHQIQAPSSTVVGHFILRASPLKHNPCDGWTKCLVGSCNGIMMLSDSKGFNFLWNPLTREFHRLPPVRVMIKKLRGLYLSVCGIGFDCATDDYKVVKIAQVFDPRDRTLKSETLIYCLELDSWRRIKDFPYRISRLTSGVFLNGALHWISSTMRLKCMGDLVVGIDLATEDYRVIPLPVLSGPEKPSAKVLGVLGGCLVLSCYYQIERLVVWSMKDYGVEKSWIKLFSISMMDHIGAVETLRPLAYSKCKRQVLLQHDKREFLWFDLETKKAKTMRIHSGPVPFSSLFCQATLVRLNHNNAKRSSRDKVNTAN